MAGTHKVWELIKTQDVPPHDDRKELKEREGASEKRTGEESTHLISLYTVMEDSLRLSKLDSSLCISR